MNHESATKRPGTAKLVLLFAVTTLISVAAAEGLSRIVVSPAPYKRSPQVRYDFHPARTFTLRPCQEKVFTLASPVVVDCNGFRRTGSAESPEAAAALTVLAIGDSFTFGMGVGDDDTWPSRLQQFLGHELGVPVRVINAGTISYGVFQELDLLREQLPRLRPDVVVHGLYWNDYHSDHAPDPDGPPVLNDQGHFVWSPDPPPGVVGSLKVVLLGRSSLWTLIRGALDRFEGPSDSDYAKAYAELIAGKIESEEFQPIDRFYESLQQLQAEYGFELYSMVLPVSDLVDRDTSDHPYRRFVVDMLERREVPFVDGFELWSREGYGRDLFLSEGPDAHLDADGYVPLARELTSKMEGDLVGRIAVEGARPAG